MAQLLTAILLVLPTTVAVGQAHAQTAIAHRLLHEGVVPDTSGTIAEVLIHYDADLEDELEPVYRDLFAALPKDVRILVVCPSKRAAEVFIETWSDMLWGRDVHVINAALPVSIWARDRLIARQPEDLSGQADGFLPVDNPAYEVEKRNDLLALEMLEQVHFIPTELDSLLHLEGGNVVSNRKHVFFGINGLRDNEGLPGVVLDKELAEILGRDYIVVEDREGSVPWLHVDMYLTPISDDLVLVANPQMADELLFRPEEDSDKCDLGRDWCSDETSCSSEPQLQSQFDDVASLVRGHGYHVRRLPALVNSTDQWMVTYNNVIMDERGVQRVVYLPVYDIPSLDRVAVAIYRSLGFDVRTIDVSRVYEDGGAIRCLVNVTRRRPNVMSADRRPLTGRLQFHDLTELRQYEWMLRRSGERVTRRDSRSRALRRISR